MLTFVGKSKFRNQKNNIKSQLCSTLLLLKIGCNQLLTFQLKTKYAAPTSFAHHFLLHNIIAFFSPNYAKHYNTRCYHEREMGVSQVILFSCQVTTDKMARKAILQWVISNRACFFLFTCSALSPVFIIKPNETANCAVSFA